MYEDFRVRIERNKYKEDEAILTWGNKVHETRLVIPNEKLYDFLAEINTYIRYEGEQDES